MEGRAAVVYVAKLPTGFWVVTASGPFPDDTQARDYVEWLVTDEEEQAVTIQ